jgi:uncharacterized LabA/DUF88 family protein
MTDVNIAVHLVADSLRDDFDIALLFCADGDLVPAVRFVKATGKSVIIVSPRGRKSDHLVSEADGELHIGTSVLGRCQLPDEVQGAVLHRRPDTWR